MFREKYQIVLISYMYNPPHTLLFIHNSIHDGIRKIPIYLHVRVYAYVSMYYIHSV